MYSINPGFDAEVAEKIVNGIYDTGTYSSDYGQVDSEIYGRSAQNHFEHFACKKRSQTS